MKKVLILLFGIILFSFSVHAYDPPGFNLNNDVECVYVTNVFADVSPALYEMQIPVLSNSYCYVSGGTRPGVVELTVRAYAFPGFTFYDGYVEYSNYGNSLPFAHQYYNGFNLNQELIIPPRSGSFKRLVVI